MCKIYSKHHPKYRYGPNMFVPPHPHLIVGSIPEIVHDDGGRDHEDDQNNGSKGDVHHEEHGTCGTFNKSGGA